MRKKRILYNEINEDIYESRYWTKSKFIFLGIILLALGFIFNFALEEKINRVLISTLSSNEACPMQFEKLELNYFLPKIIIKKIVVNGVCFGQPANRLNIDEIKIRPDFPSIAHFGMRFSIEIKTEDSKINIDPIISPFSYFIEIEHSTINGNLFHVFASDDRSAIAGKIHLQGFLKFSSGILTDGDIKMESNNFNFPSQRISGFDLPLIQLDKLNLVAKFEKPGEMNISALDIGKPGRQIEISLKGKLLVSKSSFNTSILMLNGKMKLSQAFMTNFSFVTLMLPQGHTDGKYQMTINGPLFNPGAPQFQ
jgi:type II secretion system protein N